MLRRSKNLLTIISLTATALAFGQRTIPENNRYEVVSIKQGARGVSRYGYHSSPGEVRLDNISIPELLSAAFLIPKDRLIGLPTWASSERYSLHGKSAGAANPGEQWAMWIPVLEERLRLKHHREKRQVRVYELSAQPSGIRFPEAVPGNCAPIDPNQPPSAGTDSAGRPKPPNHCGMVVARQLPGGGIELSVKGVKMADLADILTHYVDRPVVDRTATTNLFDVLLSFDNRPVGVGDSNSPSELPTIYGALNKAGLKLTRVQGDVEVMVIDRLERPSEN